MSQRRRRAEAKRQAAKAEPKPTGEAKRRRRKPKKSDALEPEIVGSKSRRGPRSRIDMATFAQMVDDGRTNKEIAAFFKVNPSRISQKMPDLEKWRRDQLMNNAQSTGEKALIVLDQIIECNDVIRDIHGQLGEYFKGSRQRGLNKNDIEFIRSITSVQREMREQMKFYIDYLERYYQISAAILFQDRVVEVLGVIKDDHPEVAGKIAGLLGTSEITE